MATHESADLQAALNGDLGGIPFRTELSLKPVIDFWTRMAGQDSPKGAVARAIADQIAKVSELLAPLTDCTVVERHAELLDVLLAAAIPPAAVRLEVRRGRGYGAAAGVAGRHVPPPSSESPGRRGTERPAAVGPRRAARRYDPQSARGHRRGSALRAQARPDRPRVDRVEGALRRRGDAAAHPVPPAESQARDRRHRRRPRAHPQRLLVARALVHLRGFRPSRRLGIRGDDLHARGEARTSDHRGGSRRDARPYAGRR